MLKRIVFAALCLCAALSLVGCGSAVPDVKGKTVEQASSLVADAGFVVGKITYDGKTDGAAGAVTAQAPEAGARAKAGALVLLTVSGPPPVAIPDLSGLDKNEASAALRASGFAVGEVTDSYDATVAVGILTSQTPAAGIDAPKGSDVDVAFSKGPQPVDVPSVKGKSEKDAISALKASGFKAKVTRGASQTKKGLVIGQTPSGGTAQPGSEVLITVSSGWQVKEMFGTAELPYGVKGNRFSMKLTELEGLEDDRREGGTFTFVGDMAKTKFEIVYWDDARGEAARDTPDYSKFMRFVSEMDPYVTITYVVEQDSRGKDIRRIISMYANSTAG